MPAPQPSILPAAVTGSPRTSICGLVVAIGGLAGAVSLFAGAPSWLTGGAAFVAALASAVGHALAQDHSTGG